MHHKHKVDAPSGTRFTRQGRGRRRGIDLTANSVRVRTAIPAPGQLPPSLCELRGGSVIGEHSVIFAGEGEQ